MAAIERVSAMLTRNAFDGEQIFNYLENFFKLNFRLYKVL